MSITEQEAKDAATWIADIGNGVNDHASKLLAALIMNILSRRDAERAEREKPITAEWLRSIGAYRESDYGGDEGYYTVDIDDDEWLSICEDGYVTTIVIADGRKQLSRKFETRGQILDLLAALKGGAS